MFVSKDAHEQKDLIFTAGAWSRLAIISACQRKFTSRRPMDADKVPGTPHRSAEG